MAISPTTALNGGATSSKTNTTGKPKQLKPEDFIKMMITQLQHQDPMAPAKNEELLAQMSQIGQLQSATTMQDSMKSLVLQNQIGSAGNLIGKSVEGLNEDNDPVSGVVNSIKVKDNNVYLELDNGKQLGLGRVTNIAQAASTSRGIAAAI